MIPEAASAANPLNLPAVRHVPPGDALRWFSLGWRDFKRAGWPSLLHGLIVTSVSLGIVEITLLFWPLLPGAVSGFVLVGPILATGLYALSQRLERGETPRVEDAFAAWRQGTRCLFRFGALLVLAGTAWVAVSVLMFHFFVAAEIDRPLAFVRYVLTQNDELFLLWALLGGLGAALVYALTVVAVPLLVDRDVGMREALLTSVRAVGENPVAMGWWAVVIMLATGFSIATLMFGFLVLYPVLGHASWHVYRDVVDTSGIPPRAAPE